MIRICSIRFPRHMFQVSENEPILERKALQNCAHVSSGLAWNGLVGSDAEPVDRHEHVGRA